MIHVETCNPVLVITERCSLKCALCYAYIPYVKKPIDMTLEDTATTLAGLFSVVSRVETLCLSGGEPTLHPQLVEICVLAKAYFPKIEKTLDIVTNGTRLFSQTLMDFLQANREKVRVIISHYGKHSPQADLLAKKLGEAGILFRVERYYGDAPLYGGWVDMRDHSLKHTTRKAMDDQAKKCHLRTKNALYIRRGTLYTCVRSYWRMHEGYLPKNPVEYVDLLDTSQAIQEKRQIFTQLLNATSTSSCAHCSGLTNDQVRHQPAEQL